ncbi:MAG: ferredoxin [Verrucomicrobiales bacterium]
MSDITERLPYNAPGQFYVDANCIACFMCSELAPASFKTNEDEGMNYVYHQTRNRVKKSPPRAEAMDACPVEAIGDDGEAANS